MNILLILTAIVVVTSLAVAFISIFTSTGIFELINHLRFLCADIGSKSTKINRRLVVRIPSQKDIDISNEPSTLPDLNVLNCRAQLIMQEPNEEAEIFQIEICGTINVPAEGTEASHAILRISILDITDGVAKAQSVHTRTKDESAFNETEQSEFSYNTDLGKLPHQVTTLSDWTVVSKLPVDLLMFPRKGQRKLQFETLILAADSGHELACAKSTMIYKSHTPGYQDVCDNIERAKTLTVALAFTVSAAKGKLYDCEIDMIKNWARKNLLDSEEQSCDKDRRKLDKALNETIAFFREGYNLNTHQICSELAGIAPTAQRYDILDLCLHVAQANGSVSADEISLLKKMADWLDIDADRFRLMMEKILPIDMYEVKDVDTILGITSDMSDEKARKHLNKEYSKWNSRVTNSDPRIQSQADQMLMLIAEARCQYATK